MVVNTKVHEAMVQKVKGERLQPTGIQAILMLERNPLLSALNQAAFANEEYHDVEQIVDYRGQPARIRVDAFPTRVLKGHVKTVATMASMTDFMSSDVKVYQTMVSIDEPLPSELGQLKPGMNAEVTIETEAPRQRVLTLPLQAISESTPIPSRGTCKVTAVTGSEESRNITFSEARCYVMTDNGPVERKIILGATNEKVAEIVLQGRCYTKTENGFEERTFTSDLKEGDNVVLNWRTLLKDQKKTTSGKDGKDQEASPGASDKKGGQGGGEKGSGKRKGGGKSRQPQM